MFQLDLFCGFILILLKIISCFECPPNELIKPCRCFEVNEILICSNYSGSLVNSSLTKIYNFNRIILDNV